MADPVLFIPGLAATAELFADQIAEVSRQRTVVLANHRRHEDIGAMAAAILDEAPRRFVLVALSMGGYVAFEDGDTSSSAWNNDGDYNDFVFLFTGITCAGAGEP